MKTTLQMFTEKPTLMEFVREARGKHKGQPRGVVIATVIDGEIRYGWSFTNVDAGDRFNKKEALRIAHERAEGVAEEGVIPHSVRKQLESIGRRTLGYFFRIKSESGTKTEKSRGTPLHRQYLSPEIGE